MSPPRVTDNPPAPGRGAQALRMAWSAVATVGVLAVTAYLAWPPRPLPPLENAVPPDTMAAPAHVVGPLRVALDPGSELARKMAIETVAAEALTAPQVTVTGSVVACRDMPTAARPEEHWLFQTPELETLYTDWVKAGADIAFTEKQLAKIRELALARTSYQQSVVDRLKKLAESGSGAQRDLLAAEAERLQGQLQAQKDIYEAENAVQSARRTRASLERQLYQAGLDPRLLERPKPSTDLVVADVPEARLNLVGLGQKCEARFYAFPGEVFKGEVVSLSPTLSRERRTLRVLFLLVDPGDRLKPGLFADIGLGTEPHRRLLVPADAVLHVGRSDYVFVADDETGVWRVAEVGLGDAHGSRYEVLSGLRAGDRVIARGAILLKPLLLEALAR